MRLKDLYESAVNLGIKNDPRPAKVVKKALRKNKKSYASLKGMEKKAFDKESLFNPYSDSRILYGTGHEDIKTMMVGIDIEGPELLLADRLRSTGTPVDLAMAHHPEGRPFAELYKVMSLQTDQLEKLGMTREVAGDLMGERISEVSRGLHARNCMRSIDTARLLGIPFMCAHTVADNMVNTFLQRLFDKKKPKTIAAAVDILRGIDEYKYGIRSGIGPKILIGDKKKRTGRVFVDMTGGTEGSKRVFARLSQIGIGTLVCMHLSEAHYKLAAKEHLNIIVAGHIPSDTLGLNLLIDGLTRGEDIEIIPCSGFVRVSRR